MGEAMAAISFSEKLYEPTKLAAIVDTLVSEGVPPADALRNVGVPIDKLHDPATRISIKQLLTACQNAGHLSQNRHLPYGIGAGVHVSAYGMYGYAILCSTSFRRAMEFATTYHPLATPLAAISFSEEPGRAIWTVEPLEHSDIHEQLYRFIVELQIGIHTSLHRDVMGQTFAPREITLAYQPTGDFFLTEELAGCPLRFGQSANRIIFDSKWLDEPPRFGNRITYAATLATCDDFLNDLSLRSGAAGKVRDILLRNLAGRKTLSDAAQMLGTTSRTLSRQLRDQGTSFRTLSDQLRSQAAMKYLRETTMTNEHIASALGFVDEANFRHAFQRWTGKTPSEYRRARRP
jgi:AraC-like DNA-binding protein